MVRRKEMKKNLVFLNKRQTWLHMTSCPGYHVVIRDSVLIKKGSTGDILKFTDHTDILLTLFCVACTEIILTPL